MPQFNAVLLLGPEEGEKQDWIDREKKKLLSEYPDLEISLFFAFETDGGDVMEALSGGSLFSSHHLVIIKHFEDAKKTSPLVKQLAAYLKEPSEDSHLFIVSELTSYSLPQEIVKCFPKDKVITFWELDETKKRNYLRNFFRQEGFGISDAAITTILSLVENNTRELRSWCTQLAIFFHSEKEKRTIEEDDINRFLTHTREEDGYTLFNAVGNGDLAKAEGIIGRILSSDQKAGIPVIAALMRQFRVLESYMQLRKSDGEDYALSNAQAISTSAVGYDSKGIKRKDQPLFRKAASIYSLQDCGRIILLLEEADASIRKAPQEQQQIELELLVHTIIEGHGKATPLALERELMDDSLRNGKRY